MASVMPLVNESALAAMPEHSEDDARYRLAELVFRRSRQLAAGSAQREMAALLRAVLRKLTRAPSARDLVAFNRAAGASGNRTGRE